MIVNAQFAAHLIMSLMGALAIGIGSYLFLNWIYEGRRNGLDRIPTEGRGEADTQAGDSDMVVQDDKSAASSLK